MCYITNVYNAEYLMLLRYENGTQGRWQGSTCWNVGGLCKVLSIILDI